MRIGTQINYAGGFADSVADIVELEKVGLDIVFVPEAYSFDAVSQLGYVAAKTERVEIASGIFQIYTRTPTLTAMTAAGLDFVSGGRFTLGLGASGPQVIEGFHGVKYDAPLARTREIIDICRQVWRRERVVHDGKHYTIPLPPEQGTGLGKPLKLINHPVRERIPILLASIGPKNVALTAELAEGWEPIFFHPEKAADVWGDALAEGKAKRDPSLPELDTFVGAALAIGDDVDHLLDNLRGVLALYIGGMGARGKNFYNDLARRYGYEAEAKLIQDLYLDGKKEEAAAAVPVELLRAISLVGPAGYVKERLAAFKEAGATTLVVNPLLPGREARVEAVAKLRELIG
ncbi:LLM class F420-dependent oxidoreductase [Amycolatopsis sp. NPDC059021]|uniref:LLM class F420-dependent oxidoreductase n=1 Tax=Amycolatopsis sp. NPDC059021 TaxID=3346704 RepID=UPI00366B3B46